jgi:hypothetical protein
MAGSIVGDVIGGITGGKGAKKAAKIQQQTTQQQIAANNANLAKITALEQPTINRGDWAGDTFAGLLGKGDGAASTAALDTFRKSGGYQDLLKTGLGAVTANAYAGGMGDSGATYKRLLERGTAIADRSQQEYLGNLNTLIQTGNSAIGNITGVSTGTTQANNGALQTAADAKGNAALISAAAWQNAIKSADNRINSFASSYGGGG